jgi:cytoskeleton protein RodZ
MHSPEGRLQILRDYRLWLPKSGIFSRRDRMLVPKKNGPRGKFFSGLSLRRPGEAAADWGRKPLSHILRQARERRKLSLQDVARLTRIPVQSLYLLEGAGEERLGAAPLSLLSSLRRYAAFLNLTPDAAVTQFIAELEQVPAVEEEAGRGAHPTQLLTHVPRPQSRVRPRPLFLLLALGLLTCVGSYSVLRREQRPNIDKNTSLPLPSAPAPETGTPPSVSSPTRPAPSADVGQSQPAAPSPAVSPPGAVASQAEPTAAAPQGKSPVVRSARQPPQPLSTSPHQLQIRAKEEAWLRLTIDGQRPRQFLLHPGQAHEWSAKREFTLTVGNAGGVALTLDGHEVPPLGKSGQVVRNIRLPSRTRDPRPQG